MQARKQEGKEKKEEKKRPLSKNVIDIAENGKRGNFNFEQRTWMPLRCKPLNKKRAYPIIKTRTIPPFTVRAG